MNRHRTLTLGTHFELAAYHADRRSDPALNNTLELYGTIKPEECPPMNSRMAKALRYLGYDVRAE